MTLTKSNEARQRVLLIDDCETVHALLKVRLKDDPVEIASAHDGETGITMAKSLAPDLILLDVDMPQLNGFDVCQRLKADPQTMNTPIIFLSGHASSEEKIRGLDLGATDYIAKPFDPAELQAGVRSSLRSKYLFDLLSKRAMIDGLTSLWNRAYFDNQLNAQIARLRRSKGPLACIMLDIDRFKALNDTYGHPFGDEVIRAVSNVLVATVRSHDIVCRYGGEEFAILLPDTDPAAARTLAERLRAAIAANVLSYKGAEVRVTCSVGVANVRNAPPAVGCGAC